MSVDPRWYESFFETEEWLLMATTRDPERTEREVAFVASHLESGARVLMLENRTHDIVTGRSQAFWTFLKDGEKRELAFDHRLYTVAEYGGTARPGRLRRAARVRQPRHGRADHGRVPHSGRRTQAVEATSGPVRMT